MAISAAEVLFSLGTWAIELGMTRDVLRRVLSERGVQPVGKRGGHPLYRGRDVFAAAMADSAGTDDPDNLKPMERKAHYQAEHEKLRLQVERGELVPSIEVEQGEAAIFKIVMQAHETLPDILERDVGLTALQLTRVEKHLDELREALYQKLNEGEDDGADSAAEVRA